MGIAWTLFGLLADRWPTAKLVQMAEVARKRAQMAEPASRDFLVGAGSYAGIMDAAHALDAASWNLARKMHPPPPAAPTADTEVLAYLAGYLVGHASVSIVHERAALGQRCWEPRLSSMVPAYTAVLALPDAQRMLTMPGEEAVERAHQYACLGAADIANVAIDPDVELMLFRWLATRSGVAIPADVDERLARLRLRREERRRDSAAGPLAS
jgi:hypothetical protein